MIALICPFLSWISCMEEPRSRKSAEFVEKGAEVYAKALFL